METDRADLDRQIANIAALADPVRRALYFYVAAQPESVTREEAAQAVGVSRGMAGFHLNKLVRDRLLVASFRRLSGRRGPGAGRPSKLYRRSQQQFRVIIPPRNYEFLALLFAQALQRTAPASNDALAQVAYEMGTRLGAEARRHAGFHPDGADLLSAAEAILLAYGFQPLHRPDDELFLRNCPFHALVDGHRTVVCRTNLALMNGLVSGLDVRRVEVMYDPQPEICCVRFRWPSPASG